MYTNIRNLYRLSKIDMPEPQDGKPLPQKIKELITGRKEATIVNMDEPIDQFPDHDETVK